MRLIDANNLQFNGRNYNKSQMKAILDFIDVQPTVYDPDKVVEQLEERTAFLKDCTKYGNKAPYQPGDILYVRETWKKAPNGYYYYESWQRSDVADITKWYPSIHMPKEAARIWLKVTDVSVERLQDITLDGCHREGINIETSAVTDGETLNRNHDFSLEKFEILWDSTVKKSDLDRYGWDAIPWVWVIEFERCEKPEGV